MWDRGQHSKSPAAQAPPAADVLYVGAFAEEVAAAVARAAPHACLHVAGNVARASLLAARHPPDVAIVDQRQPQDSFKLLIAMLRAARRPPRVVVLGDDESISEYLRIPGVRSVLTLPLDTVQLARALNVRPAQVPARRSEPPSAAETIPFKRSRLAARLTPLVSHAYRNAALVMLAALFAAFCFYGALIVFFLASQGWGAPMTLSKGHELVAKAEQELDGLRVELNHLDQKIADTALDAVTAGRAEEDARLLVEYTKGSVDQEIESRLRGIATLKEQAAGLLRTKKDFDRELGSRGAGEALAALYAKRLIDRKSYASGALGVLEARQRQAGLESELAVARDSISTLTATVDMLQHLREQLETGKLSAIPGATSDLLLLVKQSVDARSALEQAGVKLRAIEGERGLLAASRSIVAQRIAGIEAGPLGRAMSGRVDVIFVPYTNARAFHEGASLHSCAFTFVFCSRAGTVGAALPGEVVTTHPFFGKPLRGFFIEARLEDPHHASREIIHAGRAPFVFF